MNITSKKVSDTDTSIAPMPLIIRNKNNIENLAVTTGGSWIEKDGNWFYSINGVNQTGWQEIKNIWYYFDTSSGIMQNGWLHSGSSWYYMNTSGAMQTGFQIINNKKYYFNQQGMMQIGWREIDNNWYYFNSTGAMNTGWFQSNNSWHYLGENGIMQTGFQTIGGDKYYFNSDGDMQISNFRIGDTTYFTSQTGNIINSIPTVFTDTEIWSSTVEQAVQSNASIDAKAKFITQGCTTDYQKAEQIYLWIAENCNYNSAEYDGTPAQSINNWTDLAQHMFKTREGICCEYSALFFAMCKSVGVHVRLIYGIDTDAKAPNNQHEWNQFYNPATNTWENVDCTFASSTYHATVQAAKALGMSLSPQEISNFLLKQSPVQSAFINNSITMTNGGDYFAIPNNIFEQSGHSEVAMQAQWYAKPQVLKTS